MELIIFLVKLSSYQYIFKVIICLKGIYQHFLKLKGSKYIFKGNLYQVTQRVYNFQRLEFINWKS